MGVEELIQSLDENPDSWPLRMSLAEELVRIGDVDRAKLYIRESPDHVEMPGEYPARIHTLFTLGVDALEPPGIEPVPAAPEHPVSDSRQDVEPHSAEASESETSAPGTAVSASLDPGARLGVIEEAVHHDPVLLTEQTATPAAMNVDSHSGSNVALALVDCDMVAGAPAPVNKGDKMGSVAVAIVVHFVLIFLLIWTKFSEAPPNPPMISISSVATSDESSVTKETLSRNATKTASPIISSQLVISAASYSSLTIPDSFEIGEIPIVSLEEIETGFGAASIGAGDVANRGAVPSDMRSRCSMSERIRRLEQSGGERRAEMAVVMGLDYLTSQQDSETGSFGKTYPVAMTGFALLCYLGHCETPESVYYGDAVVKATLYLIDKAIKNNGLMTSSKSGNHRAYEHAIATYALAELYTMSRAGGKKIPRIEAVLKKAVQGIVNSQKELGGWAYLGGGDEDMSVSGWNIQALKAVHNTGIDIKGVRTYLDRAVGRYLPAIQDGKGAFKYRPRDGNGKRTLTGAALLGMQVWGKMGSEHYNKGFKYLHSAYKNPFPDSNYYAPYYNTQVFFLHGGKPWIIYNEKFQGKLLDTQQKDGSWPAMGGHGGDDKKFLNTAWAILMLEVYYRYLPTTDKIGDLQRGNQKR